jgi:hypothetical protein
MSPGGLLCIASLLACSGTASTPGAEAGTGAQNGSSSGGHATMTQDASSSSGGGNVGVGSGSGGSSNSGGSSSGGSSNSGGSSSGGASRDSSGGNGGGAITGGSSGSSGGMAMENAGATGQGGAADGAGGSGEAASGGGGAGCPTAAVFCDDFESGKTLGSAWTIDNSVAANTVTMVSTKSHSGSSSVHMTFTPTAGTTFIDEKMGVTAKGTVWGRVWMYPNTEAGNGIGPDPHVVYIEAEPAGFTGHSATGVRPLNTQSGQIAINVDPPDTGPIVKMVLPRGAWHCFEWEISGIGGTGSVALYMDGTLLATDSGTAIAAIGEMRIGYEHYNAGTTTGDLYLDDYAIGPTRLGCN